MKPIEQIKRDIADVLRVDYEEGIDGGAGFVVWHDTEFRFIWSCGMGWEHVSVSTRKRCPTWDEMCFFKDLFWRPDEAVVQFHPAQADYVNRYRFCLHLWKPTDVTIAAPPKILVG